MQQVVMHIQQTEDRNPDGTFFGGGSNHSLGRYLNGCVKIQLSGCATRSDRAVSREWRFNAILPHTAEMKRNGFFNPPKGDINRFTGRNTARKIGHRRTPIAIWVSVNANEVL